MMDDLLTGGGELHPVRKAPPPPKVQHKNNNSRRLRSAPSLNDAKKKVFVMNSSQKKVPPPRPPPPKLHQNNGIHSKPERNQKNKSRLLSRLRGHHSSHNPSPQVRPNQHHTTSNGPRVNEVCLIDFASPPHSPTTGSGSDGLSVNSFSSETSGTHSGGFDDHFDPFGSIQEESLAQDPFGPIREKCSKMNSFDSFEENLFKKQSCFDDSGFGTRVSSVNSLSNSISFNDDPFEMIALRSQVSEILAVEQNENKEADVNPLFQSSSASEIQKTSNDNPKSNFRTTIIRPKTTTLNKEQNCLSTLPQSTTMPSLLDNSSIPFDGPPLPPRPLSLDEDGDQPYGIAEFDFEKTQPDDLEFKVGDKIQLLYSMSEEWFFGRLGIQEGMFPSNFIKVIIPLPTKSEQTPTVSLNYSAYASPAKELCQENRTFSDENILYATALYDFAAEMPEDLTIYEGATIKLIGRLNEEWIYGELNEQKGQFPANFIDKIPPSLKLITL